MTEFVNDLWLTVCQKLEAMSNSDAVAVKQEEEELTTSLATPVHESPATEHPASMLHSAYVSSVSLIGFSASTDTAPSTIDMGSVVSSPLLLRLTCSLVSFLLPNLIQVITIQLILQVQQPQQLKIKVFVGFFLSFDITDNLACRE